MQRAIIGDRAELEAKGFLAGKVGSQPVCVFWNDGEAYAVDDRCPHMGFPLHRGTVENGLLTCHWHHARFDLASGGTLDPFADDVGAHDVTFEGSTVAVTLRSDPDPSAHLLRRLEEGLERGFSLVIAKAVLGLLESLGPTEGPRAVLRAGVEFGVRNREQGWGAGLTVLTAMANVLPMLDPDDQALALVHGLAFVSRDTRGRAPRFPLAPLPADIEPDRLRAWYRRFTETRNGDAAERVLATAAEADDPSGLAGLVGAAVTDHVFLDGGHSVDFTNKAFEVLGHLSPDRAGQIVPSLAHQIAAGARAEETGSWRHPHDLAGLLDGRRPVGRPSSGPGFDESETEGLAWSVLGEDPVDIVAGLDRALEGGASYEQLARAVAYAGALRLVRFHTQNDHGDWDVVHHSFTAANATHQMICRAATPEVARGIYQVAMAIFLDRFLNVPAARPPGPGPRPDLAELEACWEREGMVDESGALVARWLRSGGSRRAVVAALGSALLREDCDFHWYQTYEAAVRQSAAWPEGSEPATLILVGAARFVAAHTPTRRELSQVVRTASRLRRGEALYEEI